MDIQGLILNDIQPKLPLISFHSVHATAEKHNYQLITKNG